MSSEQAEPKKTVLVLITNLGTKRAQVENRSMLEGKRIRYETIDGADPDNKEAYVLDYRIYCVRLL